MRISKLVNTHYSAVKAPFKYNANGMRNNENLCDVVEFKGSKSEKSEKLSLLDRFMRFMGLDLDEIDREVDENYFAEDPSDVSNEEFEEDDYDEYSLDPLGDDEMEDDSDADGDEAEISDAKMKKAERKGLIIGIGIGSLMLAAANFGGSYFNEYQRNKISNASFAEEYDNNPVGTTEDFYKYYIKNDKYPVTYGAAHVHSSDSHVRTMTKLENSFSAIMEYPGGLVTKCDFRKGIDYVVIDNTPLGEIKKMGYLEKAALDVNGDNVYDITFEFDENGELKRSQLDIDLDGKMDVELVDSNAEEDVI